MEEGFSSSWKRRRVQIRTCILRCTHEDPHGLITGIQEWFLSGEKLYGFLGGEGRGPLVR